MPRLGELQTRSGWRAGKERHPAPQHLGQVMSLAVGPLVLPERVRPERDQGWLPVSWEMLCLGENRPYKL